MLLIIKPISLVYCAVSVGVLAVPVSLPILPITNVHISIHMNHAAFTLNVSLDPITLVDAAVGPYLLAKAMTLVGFGVPLTSVLGVYATVGFFDDKLWSLFKRIIYL